MKSHQPLARTLALLCVAPLALWLGGCATASLPANMTPTALAPEHRSASSVFVQVSGGSETTLTTGPNISNADFAAAIRQSITNSGLFAKTFDAAPADYRLDVMIVRVQQPIFGASFTVPMECSWRLTHLPDKAVLWEKSITSQFTANFSDALVGVTRLRLATEGAARANISDAITQMGRLPLQ